MSKYGFVYIMSNQKDVYKIGCTERSPMQRAIELSSSTGVVNDFQVICYGEYADYRVVEALMHRQFAARRINQSREFFKGPFTDLFLALRDGMPDYICSFCDGEGPVYAYDEGRQGEI